MAKSQKHPVRKPPPPAPAKTVALNRLSGVVPFVLLILACLAVYGRVVQFGLTGFDDDTLVKAFAGKHHSIADAFTHNAFMMDKGIDFYRPLQSAGYILDAAISGASPVAWHATSIILHCIAVCCLFWLLGLLGFDRKLTFFAALLYAVHPLFCQAVAWIPGRGDLLLGVFSLVAFASFIRFTTNGGRGYLAVHLAAFACAVYSKETALLLPPILLLYWYLYHRRSVPLVRNLIPATGWILGAAVYLYARHSALSGFPDAKMFGIVPFLSNLRALPEMLAELVNPFAIKPMPAFTTGTTLLGVAAAAVLIALCIGRRNRIDKAVILGVCWYLLLSIPGMLYRHNLGSHAYDYLNQRAYLPMAGIFIALAAMVPAAWYASGKKAIFAWATAAAVILAVITWIQNDYYAEPMTFLNRSIRTNPGSTFAYYVRGRFRVDAGDLRGALKDFDEANRLSPEYVDVYNNRGIDRFQLGDLTGALQDFDAALRIRPDEGAFANRGNARTLTGDLKGAMDDYNHSLGMNPKNANALIGRAKLKEKIGDLPGAIGDLKLVMGLEAPDASHYLCLGQWQVRVGDTASALESLTEATRLDRRIIAAWNSLGAIYGLRKQFDLAAQDFQAAIDNDPHFTDAMVNLSRIRFLQRDTAGSCALLRTAAEMGDATARELLARSCR